MRLPRDFARRAAVGVMASSTAILLMLACSSTEDVRGHSDYDSDAGEPAAPDAERGATGETGTDASHDAADEGELTPPRPYDFAVKCESTPCVTRIAARGGAHACVVLEDGSVRCWGANASGQLGTGGSDAGSMPVFETTPRQVLGVANATAVAATGDGASGTTCVVSGSGEVACFGANASGQLGRGTSVSRAPFPEPAPVGGLQAKAVALTNTFALAIDNDDRLWSWGANDVLQLARDMSLPDAGSPNGAARADRVSTMVRSCAGTSTTGFVVSEDGELVSWGGGALEQMGRPVSFERDPIPAAIALSDVSSVATGTAHACALRRGRVHCWGQNEHGQLGTARKADEPFPSRALLPPEVYAVAVAAGGNNTCAITANGDLYCWGANGSGQVGTSTGLDQPTPRRIDGLAEETVAMAVMDTSICALLRGGSVACWGGNLHGQLGRGGRDADQHVEPAPAVFK